MDFTKTFRIALVLTLLYSPAAKTPNRRNQPSFLLRRMFRELMLVLRGR